VDNMYELNGWGMTGGIVGFVLVSAINPYPAVWEACLGALILGHVCNVFGGE
jgi:hypothetical protein